MGVNDELTPREHDAMRETLLAGARRIKPVGAHRMQIIAGAVALTLVAGVAGGAIAAANLFGSAEIPPVTTPSPTVTESATPTPTPTATPTPTEEALPTTAVASFGGDCANALTEAEASEAAGEPVTLRTDRWRLDDVLGGITCLWMSTEAYFSGVVSLSAYPAAVAPASIVDGNAPGCSTQEDGGMLCVASGEVDGVWMALRVDSLPGNTSSQSADALFAQAAQRLASFPVAVPEARTEEWWAQPTCSVVSDAISPAELGVPSFESRSTRETAGAESALGYIGQLAGVAEACVIYVVQDGVEGVRGTVSFFSGAAVDFARAPGFDAGRPVDVDRAETALILPPPETWDGAADLLMVSDGVNVLVLDSSRTAEDMIPLAAALLARLG